MPDVFKKSLLKRHDKKAAVDVGESLSSDINLLGGNQSRQLEGDEVS